MSEEYPGGTEPSVTDGLRSSGKVGDGNEASSDPGSHLNVDSTARMSSLPMKPGTVHTHAGYKGGDVSGVHRWSGG